MQNQTLPQQAGISDENIVYQANPNGLDIWPKNEDAERLLFLI